MTEASEVQEQNKNVIHIYCREYDMVRFVDTKGVKAQVPKNRLSNETIKNARTK